MHECPYCYDQEDEVIYYVELEYEDGNWWCPQCSYNEPATDSEIALEQERQQRREGE